MEVLELGRMAYQPCVELQRSILEEVVERERASTLILVEHDPVLTLGANFHEENLLLPIGEYERKGIEVVRTDRGGDVTFHGPGQLVAYPIFDLQPLGKDLHRWLRELEETVITALATWELEGTRNPINTGVWIGNRKICAMGIKVRRWVSMHGLALNCDADLSPFNLVVPCGIRGAYGVTSISRECGRTVPVDEAKPVLIEAFRSRYG
ncbi:lipoyl(octanoyl) transferase LipB [Fimbriimonas ginsengisoli]|uniref:Octanoyltransferase n=1 Tax=Fimbriimonas ginsengisoli Gsoil 348 TaxID=661478 RepID=A0A068NUH4_FIMGI|nr:lipoyl(octanoyl) transferase LipB [Fimbriimonas ginsengisoli]AIE85269.1 Octanoate-[acyl-carrier-protein]-protein-N-octanoyltransferase [Fimbriimonas ginsengisoli Gsoil 348]